MENVSMDSLPDSTGNMNASSARYGIIKRKKAGVMMYWTLIVCLIIAAVVLVLAVVTTSKAYTYQHTVDPLPEERSSEQQAGPKQPR
ncbi:YtzI protein [Geobacillus thermocatenulatus]|uniref:YtzI protein n=2 Tax=Anoxybacillaceae TaxID=3120669 RepID=A0AA91YUF3_9BACL|nr:YtzI protein [Geobacillus thermocatenulatus]